MNYQNLQSVLTVTIDLENQLCNPPGTTFRKNLEAVRRSILLKSLQSSSNNLDDDEDDENDYDQVVLIDKSSYTGYVCVCK